METVCVCRYSIHGRSLLSRLGLRRADLQLWDANLRWHGRFGLALGWFGNYDGYDLAALALLSHGPTVSAPLEPSPRRAANTATIREFLLHMAWRSPLTLLARRSSPLYFMGFVP